VSRLTFGQSLGISLEQMASASILALSVSAMTSWLLALSLSLSLALFKITLSVTVKNYFLRGIALERAILTTATHFSVAVISVHSA